MNKDPLVQKLWLKWSYLGLAKYEELRADLDTYAFSIVEQALPPADFMAAPPLKTSLENAKAGGFNLCRQQIRDKARELTNQPLKQNEN